MKHQGSCGWNNLRSSWFGPFVSPLVRRLNNELADALLLTHGGETWKTVTGLLFKSSEFGFIALEAET